MWYEARIRVVLVLVAAAASACATPYGAKGTAGDGVESRYIDDGYYYIEVVVNRATAEGQAEEYFQRRAEEVCKGDGFSDWETVETSTEDVAHPTMVSNGKGGFTTQPGSFFKLSGHVRCLNPATELTSSAPAAPASKPAGTVFNKLDRDAGLRFRGIADMYFEADDERALPIWLDVVSITADAGKIVPVEERQVVFVFEWRPELAADAACDELVLLLGEDRVRAKLERDGRKAMATLSLADFRRAARASELEGRVCGQKLVVLPEQQKQLRLLAELLSADETNQP